FQDLMGMETHFDPKQRLFIQEMTGDVESCPSGKSDPGVPGRQDCLKRSSYLVILGEKDFSICKEPVKISKIAGSERSRSWLKASGNLFGLVYAWPSTAPYLPKVGTLKFALVLPGAASEDRRRKWGLRLGPWDHPPKLNMNAFITWILVNIPKISPHIIER
ncbi:1290_t:CDS:2, partial [Acaulospora colombiana]